MSIIMAFMGHSVPRTADINKRFGTSVKQARIRAQLTQRELAARIELERTSVSNIEVGLQTVTIPTLVLLCQALQVPVTDLVQTAPSELESLDSVNGKYARSAQRLLKAELRAN